MATGEIRIPAPIWQPLDGTTNNVPPAANVAAGTTTNKNQIPYWGFNDDGTVHYVCYVTRMPINYASGGSLKIHWMCQSTTSANVVWQAQVQAITPGDADTPVEHAWSTAATVTSAVNTTEARRLVEASITLNMDSAAAGDYLSFLLFRDPGHASDTAGIQAEFISAAFQYTTT